MKKILTTTLITALLATSGFAMGNDDEDDAIVGKVVYKTATFKDGTDSYDSTIMPSGRVNIGDSSNVPVIASTWTLEEGSITYVCGNGFKLTGTLNINPRYPYTIPWQCALDDSEKLYYCYSNSKGEDFYKLTDDGTGPYICSDGTIPEPQPDPTDLTQITVPEESGVPLMYDNRANAVIDMAYDSDSQKVQGKICGGSVTYATEGASILSSDDTTEFAVDSSLTGKTKYKLGTADSAGFQENYLQYHLPTLKCDETHKLDFTDGATYSTKVSDTSTLKGYLESFGFYPKNVSVLSGQDFAVLATKDASAAIQIPKDAAFSTKASGKEHKITASLHDVGVDDFENALKFTGTYPANKTELDTLVFSGDNSNLDPAKGVTYCNVNATFCKANSWIYTPKDQLVTFQGDGIVAPTVTICDNMKISHDLKISKGANLAIGKDKKVLFFGGLTLGGD